MADQLSSDLASLRINREEDPDAKAARRTWIAIGVGAVVVVAVLAFVVSKFTGGLMKPEVEVTEVRMISPAQSSVEVTSTGYVVAQVSAKLTAKVLGRIADVKVREGQQVKEGDLLVQLESTEQRATVAAARARAAAARATLAETKRQYEREKGLVEQGASARSVVEDLSDRVNALTETAKAADAEVDALEITLQQTTIRAPINGVVLGKPMEVGELVGPGTGPVLELADFTSLMVETDVPESKLHLVQTGSPAEIVLDAYPSKRHRGAVAEISPRVNRAKATVIVKVKFVDEAPGVLPDMAARVSFLSKALDAEQMKEPPKLVVPAAAVVERAGAKVVFRVDDGRARMAPVTLGAPMGNGFELVQGPSEGTRLVANPPATLADGAQIKERTR